MIQLRSLKASLLALALVTVGGCGDDSVVEPPLSPQATPAGVIKALQQAYRFRNIDEYSKLFADDVTFFFDPISREREALPEFWNRLTDSVATEQLFHSAEIRLSLSYSPIPLNVNESGREHWVYIDVEDASFEITLVTPSHPEGITHIVEAEDQRFYFRKGRTDGDTEASSPTSSLYFIVEWRNKPPALGRIVEQ
jgi:hypothetical protein